MIAVNELVYELDSVRRKDDVLHLLCLATSVHNRFFLPSKLLVNVATCFSPPVINGAKLSQKLLLDFCLIY